MDYNSAKALGVADILTFSPCGTALGPASEPAMPLSPVVAASEINQVVPSSAPQPGVLISPRVVTGRAGGASVLRTVQRVTLRGALVMAMLLPVLGRPATAATLAEAVEAAWARTPEAGPIAADRTTQEARRSASSRFFPNAPYAQVDGMTDRPTTNRGFTSFGAEVGTPLWLPGEGSALGRQAGVGVAETEARMLALRLATAGVVRDAVGLIEEAALAIPPQQRRAVSARQLGALVERRAGRGESPQADALLARSEALVAEASLQDQQALLAQALARFTVLTGQSSAPGLAQDRTPPLAALPDHPRLLASQRNVELAQAGVEVARRSSRDSPVLALQGRQEQSITGERYQSRIGVLLRIPFATEARNAPRVAAAQADLTRAESQLALVQRELDIDIRQSRLALEAAGTQRRLAEANFSALNARRGQLEQAFTVGEIPLVELVRARLAAFDADLTRARTLSAQNRARSRLNQALGVMP